MCSKECDYTLEYWSKEENRNNLGGKKMRKMEDLGNTKIYRDFN